MFVAAVAVGAAIIGLIPTPSRAIISISAPEELISKSPEINPKLDGINLT